MKVLLIDSGSYFLDFALRAREAGHEVRWFLGPLKGGEVSPVGDGFGFKKVSSWEPHMKWADMIVVSDNAKYTHFLESYRNQGFPIFGANKETTEWELDRNRGQEIMQASGINVIPSVEFKSYNEAIAYVKTNMKRYVSKPNGDAEKALSYVSKSPADLVFMLERWKRNNKLKDSFILQEFHEGIEMAVGGYFGPGGFNDYVLENFEHKKLMNDDKGVNTGEMGTVMKYMTFEQSRLAQEVLRPIEGELYRQGYTGYIDVAVIIDRKGEIWPLEFTSRFGWPLAQIVNSLHDSQDSCEWMYDLLHGFDSFFPSTQVSTGVVVAMPDFPYSRLTRKETTGFPLYGIKEEDWLCGDIHLAECMWDKAPVEENGKIIEKDMVVSAGDYTYIASGQASSISASIDRAYKNVKKVELPNSPIYRTDIGKRLEKQIPELQKNGFATDWVY
jgi:phosphoribosylamine---glycine ligase